MTRFAAWSLIVDCKDVALISIINDWISAPGKPRRIIMDNSPPGMFGADRDELSRTYVIQLVHAPR